MSIVTEWLAMLPDVPEMDEYGRPWEHQKRAGKTPAQQAYYAAIAAQHAPSEPEITAQPAPSSRPPINYRVCVVDDTHVYSIRAGKVHRSLLPEVKNVGDLLQVCEDLGLDALWVLPETALSERATDDFMVAEQWEIKRVQYPKGASVWDDDRKRATFVRAWKKLEYRDRSRAARGRGIDQGRALHIGYAEHEISYGFETITNPVALLAAVSYTEDATGTPLRFSAQSTGKYTMIESTRGKHANWIQPVALPEKIPLMANDCVWRRALAPEEIAAGGYLITADKNSMYMAACTSAMLPEGDPEYLNGEAIAAIEKLPTGIYHIRLHGESVFDGKQLPHPTDGRREGWAWVYTVTLARDLGYQVEIIEGYIWRAGRSHTTLRKWAEHMWDARAALKSGSPDETGAKRYAHNAARQAAYLAINTIIRGGMGLLDHEPEYDGPDARLWFHPEWYALIIDLARCKMFYVIKKYYDAQGLRPIAVYTDCLYYLGETDNHLQELPEMYARADKLGGFKRKYERTITVAQLAPLFADTRLPIETINMQFLAYDRGEIEL